MGTIFGGVAGTIVPPLNIYMHNDAGGNNCNKSYYIDWLKRHDPTLGFAHYYVCSDGILQAEDESCATFHCGNPYGNLHGISIEVCQSMGDLEQFKKNESKALDLAADICVRKGITPKGNIKLHCEVTPTECPHRSLELHGSVESTKQYFENEIVKRMNESEVFNMGVWAFYVVEGVGCVYWFNGDKIRPFGHPDEMDIVNRIYRANTGKDVPTFKFTKSAPWNVRLAEVLKR